MTQKLSKKELEEKALKLYGSEESFKKAVALVESSKKNEFFEEIARMGIHPNSEFWAMLLAYYNVSLLNKDIPKSLSDFESTLKALSSKFNLELSDTMESSLIKFKDFIDNKFEALGEELEIELSMVHDEKIGIINQSKEDLSKSVNAIAEALNKVNHDFEIFETRILSVIDKASEGAIAKQQAEITNKVMATIKKEIPIVIGTTMKKQYNLWALDRFFRDVGVVVLAGSVLGILFKLFM